MSYDVLVAVERPLELGGLGEKLAKWSDIKRVETTNEQIIVWVRLANGGEIPFFVAMPVQCEAEDLDEQFFSYVKEPRWLIEISVPGAAGDEGVKVARRVAASIAKETRGAAFDPQEDGVFWPRRQLLVRPRRLSPLAQNIDIVSLNWIVALPNDRVLRASKACEVFERFLDVVAGIQPAAVPLKCGTYEPLQGKSLADFEREWRLAAEAERGGMFSFTARPPYFGGDVSFVYPRPSLESPKHSLSCVALCMDVEASGFDVPSAEQKLSGEFAKIADGVAAMYGAAFYLRGYENIGGQLMVPRGAEARPPLTGNGWIGIPPAPAWLVWLHAAYLDELDGQPATAVVGDFSHGAAFVLAKRLNDAGASPLLGARSELLSCPGKIPHGAAVHIPPYERFAARERG